MVSTRKVGEAWVGSYQWDAIPDNGGMSCQTSGTHQVVLNLHKALDLDAAPGAV